MGGCDASRLTTASLASSALSHRPQDNCDGNAQCKPPGLGDGDRAELEIKAVAVHRTGVVAARDRQVAVQAIGEFEFRARRRFEVQQTADEILDECLAGEK